MLGFDYTFERLIGQTFEEDLNLLQNQHHFLPMKDWALYYHLYSIWLFNLLM